MKSINAFILLFVMSLAFASCTDLDYHEYTDIKPDMDPVNGNPAISLRAEQSPDNKVINGSTIEIPKGTETSASKQLRIFAKNPLDNVLEPGRYLLPIIGTSVLGELSDSTVFVDVTVRTPYEDPDGYELYTGEDMFTVFYINTSAFEPRLANDMILTERIPSSGVEYKGLGNIVNLRTASVGYDSTTGKVSIQPSADLRYVLEHSSERVLPVQESGRKVCVCMQWEESSPENI